MAQKTVLTIALLGGFLAWHDPVNAQEPVVPCELLDTCQQDELQGLIAPSTLTSVRRFVTAASLYDLCVGNDEEQAVCRFYIAGVHDSAEMVYWRNDQEPPWCPVDGFTSSTLQEVVLDYLDNHPEVDPLPAAHAVTQAFSEGLICN
ncbi:Rap1a/Tai family immunity protein [Limibacillus sp. MBR-115]|jgi:hypothetical protein|uniref:Rap1a/Tai family immunity protein n=1 Tax=Limibacillus sp. MBR-115 TaxID=3156465 RepID=UPI0033913994